MGGAAARVRILGDRGFGKVRKAAVAAIEKIGATAVWFERFGGRDSDPNQAYLDEMRSTDI